MVNQTCFYHRKYIGIDTIFGMVEIFEVTQPHDSFLAALNDLLPQLSASAQPMSMNSLVELVQSNAVHLYLATVDGENGVAREIVGNGSGYVRARRGALTDKSLPNAK